ncbi:ras-associated and pleckstrin homology domains-containing protein 1-like isoform X3 [Mytilus californianus]|nr:ras-associated and pleckstrin homology domains-containing protein 1-like isoform X3 [Mytilus californianus]
MEDEDYCYRPESEVEADSDHEDQDAENELGQWLGQLETLKMDLDSDGTDTVRRRNKTIVTPKMAMESFRFSFLNSDENQDVNFDAILGELCDLEMQLNTTEYELDRNNMGLVKDEHRDSGNDLAQSELDALASEITQSLSFRHSLPYGDLELLPDQFLTRRGSCSDAHDICETDSAFSENASLPSSESFTSMVTVSSSAEASSSGSGDSGSTVSTSTVTPFSAQVSEMHELLMSQLSLFEEELHKENCPPDEQKARLKAEKIRIALEKIKEAKIRKLFVRAFAKDGSSKSILVDEKMSIGQVCSILADKNHVRLNAKLAVIEHMPDLYMERILEDHDCLVENMVMWTRDSRNRILFEERQEKFDLFRQPEKYLLVSSSSEKGASLAPNQRHKLVQEFFNGSAQVPEVEGVMYLKSEGKKAWKKFYFVLRASGLYYNPKGKVSKAPKDLTCMVQFAYVDVYYGLGWKKKYHAPTDHGFALKHPQIQKKTSKYIRYFCTENKAALDQWIMGIRMAKYGKQLQDNYEKLRTEVSTWDSRELRTSVSDPDTFDESLEFIPGSSLQDSRLSMPEPGSRHSIVHVQNSTLVRNSAGSDTTICESSDEIMCLEMTSHHERKSSLTGQNMYEVQRPVVKRVSFSNTHSVINSEGEEIVPLRHRDSITSSSTESSEDSISSGEMRFNSVSRASKMRARIPVTTETTRHMSEMYQQTMDGSSISSCESYGTHERKSSLTSPIHSHSFTEKDRRKSAPVIHGEGKETRHERKSSDSSREFKVRSISGDKEPLYENMHERKSSDDSREFKIHSRKASNEGVKESRHERKSSDGSRELKVRSQIIPSERGIQESRHDRKGSDGSRELKVRSQAIPNDRYIQESHHERKGSNSSQDSLNRQNQCDKISGIHGQQLLTDVKRTGSPPPPNKQVQSTQNYKRPQTPPPTRPIQPIEEVVPPYSSLPISPPPNRVMSPAPSRERLCTPPPPPTNSTICNMRERLTSPPPPPIQRVMSPPTVKREMTSHSRSSSSSSHYSNLSTEDHFPVPPGECHKMSSYPQPPSTLMSPMSNKSMATPAPYQMTSPGVSNKVMPQSLPHAIMSPPMLSHQPASQLVMSPPASKHFPQNALPLSHPIASQMSPPVSSDFATPPSPAPPAMIQTAASIQSSYSMQNDAESSPSTPRSCVPMPPAMPLLQNRYVSLEIGGITPLRKTGPETVVHTHAPQMSPPIVNHQPGAYNMPTQKHRPSPLSCSTQAYNSQNSQNVISPTMYSPEGQHFNAMTTSGPQFAGPYDQMYQCGPQRVMSSSMPTSNSSMIPQSNLGKTSAIYDSYGNSHQPQNHMSVQSSVSSSDDHCHLPQQLPFLSELSQRPQRAGGKVPPATLPKPDSGPKNIQKYNGANSYELGVTSPNGPLPSRPNSNIGNKSRPPPPPPQRSENTRLSSEIKTTSADIHSVPNYDPLYEILGECEGLIDINDLPLPPPELLEGIGGGVPKKGKVPPPPPKRSSDTQLTSQ